MMRKLRFELERSTITPTLDAAYLADPDPDLSEELAQAVYRSIGIDVQVRVGGITLFLAAWKDPEHWSTEWMEALGCECDDVPEAVAALLAGAVSG